MSRWDDIAKMAEQNPSQASSLTIAEVRASFDEVDTEERLAARDRVRELKLQERDRNEVVAAALEIAETVLGTVT